ncbi:Transposon Ty3-G Gag-Pol polyprotein [Penaeus vannamei]|uniref:Transposon Ty3-G Gag-Pol polyprotein n=1 Tax=Penaeus vannamei TaxID=6689 RepID=A0A423TV27_PENVA|nr:Transposon Ty3-G Gag-Pol polyprotein [Penaeus vannamei]
MMDQIFGKLPFCVVYVDDILIFSRDQEHHQHVRTILHLLKQNGLVVSLDKCILGASSIDFLGYKIQSQAASILAPLQKAVAGNKTSLTWSHDQEKGFIAAKTALARTTILAWPTPNAQLYLTTKRQESCTFFSRKLRPPERMYSTFNRELLAIHLAVRHFCHMLEGDAWSERQQQQLSAIAETGCTKRYLLGSQNAVADSLSCIEISIQLGVDYKALAAEQERDPNLSWERVTIGDMLVLCDISTSRPRPLYLPHFGGKSSILAHPSIRSTAKLVLEKFMWHSMKRDLRDWPAIRNLPQPKRRFGQIHVDVVGPLPQSEGKRYIFTIIDRSTRWPEATPMEDATTRSCAQALLDSWIARFGLPEHITSDRGASFTSELHMDFAATLGASWAQTTPKEDLAHSAAEMVYGQPLVVAGENSSTTMARRHSDRRPPPGGPEFRSQHTNPSLASPVLYPVRTGYGQFRLSP